MTKEFKLNYGGVEIPFVTDFSDSKPIMVNANKMAQCFPGKRLDNFLANRATKDYIDALSRNIGIPIFDLVVTKKGGNDKNNQGTWMHKDLAIEFARWLNPSFAVWCNRKIRELILNQTATLENDNIQLKQICSQMEPYANYGYELLESSKMTYSTSRILKECSCKISIQEVFKRLVDEGYVGRYRNSNSWFLKVPYGRRNYTTLVSKIVNGKNGQPDHTVNQVRWTESGRLFLRSVLSDWHVI